MIMGVVLVLAMASCAETVSGTCNICPSHTAVDLDSCAEQGVALGCGSTRIVEVTDDDCAIGETPMTHQVCEYTDCDEAFECSLIADR
jgi:hypothetical protein